MPRGRHTRRRRWAIAAALVAALLVAAGATASWHFSSAVLVPDNDGWPMEIEVERVTSDRISLEGTEETSRPGVYGLEWPGGHAIVGRVLAEDDGTVTRELREVRGYLPPGRKVGIDTNVYSGNPAESLGLPYEDVVVKSELGPMPAWLVPAKGKAEGRRAKSPSDGTWAILVHGINSSPEVGLRIVPWLRRAGYPSLLITYREDLGAPESPDGFHHMGLTEWRDLQAAARFALDHGARRLLLFGYSMGGSLVTQFLEKSPLAPRAAAAVLDAPVLDWREVLRFNATEMGYPAPAALPVQWAIGARIDADWESLDAGSHPEDFHLPILLFHGTEDDTVPIATSEDFAEELPRWVTYYAVPRAGHTQGWNVSPQRYQARLGRFLREALPTQRARPRRSGSE